MRSTRQPRLRSVLLTSRSRCAFRASLAFQNATRVFGMRAWRGQPCQKQPSTKTASFAARKTKSGLPSSGAPRRQPVMRCSRINAISRSSVARFPCERMRDIRSERSTAVSVSATATFWRMLFEVLGDVRADFRDGLFAWRVFFRSCPCSPRMKRIPRRALI